MSKLLETWKLWTLGLDVLGQDHMIKLFFSVFKTINILEFKKNDFQICSVLRANFLLVLVASGGCTRNQQCAACCPGVFRLCQCDKSPTGSDLQGLRQDVEAETRKEMREQDGAGPPTGIERTSPDRLGTLSSVRSSYPSGPTRKF